MGRDDARTRCSFLSDSESREVREGCRAGSAVDDEEVQGDPCRVEAPSELSGTVGVMPAGLPSPWAGLFADVPKEQFAGEDSHSLPSARSSDSDMLHRVYCVTQCSVTLCWAALAEAWFACLEAVAD